MPDAASRTAQRTWLAVAAASAVALAAAAFLAWRNAPRPDEFHTLSHVGHGGVGELWRSYRSADDATPPVAYLFSWSAARVLGTSLLAVRIPFVVSWALAAGALAALVRRSGPWAALAAGLVPTATALVYLGAYARAYAPVLACLALAACAWQRAADVERPGGWLVAVGVLGALATALHYAAIVAVVLLAAATVVLGRGRPHRRGRTLAPLLGGVAGLVPLALVASQAFDAQGDMADSARPLDAVAFWPSAASPAWPLLLAAALVLGVAWLVDGLGGRDGRGIRMERELAGFGWATAAVVPVVTVAAMLATSGIYFHRYGVGALVGAAIVVAQLVGAAAGRRAVGPLVVGLLLVSCAFATRDAAQQMLSNDRARDLPGELELAGGDAPVVVVNEYDYLLLRRYGDDALRGRLALLAEPGVVDSPDPVDLDALVASGEPFELVGSDAEVAALAVDGRVPAGDPVAGTEYPRPGSPRVLVHVRVQAAP
ncbi:MAG TPA: glycosyltransferase family 39 protein [Acidimicrobiales bacterium]|nr:glycosyltransferase family 39 protein [Acidimicrobiales bacterium]